MRFIDSSTLVKTSLLTAIALPSVLASEVNFSELGRRHAHSHQKKHEHQHQERKVEKRGTCAFPGSNKMVAVASSMMNAGWALPPDQPCTPGMYCPYACPPGYLMGQWDPDATSYTYPMSMNGGLKCGNDGQVSIPFPDKEFCYPGAGTFVAHNLLSQPVAICQTVLPGREDMLIPTLVGPNESVPLAVPGPEYWCGTAAHYYINPPGVSVAEGCIWGSTANPRGNWTPYVAGANIDNNGNTFTKIGWNPIYLEPTTPFRNVRPDWGVKIICEEGKQCNGLPCIIDPAVDAVNAVNTGRSGQSTGGAGGGNFCVVTAPKGTKAILVTFPAGKGDDDSAAVPLGDVSLSSSSDPTSTTEAPPTTTSTTESSTSTSTSTSSTSTSTSTTTSTTTTSTSTTESSTSTSTSCDTTSTSVLPTAKYRNTTTSAYTPTLTPVNQGVSNVTADASLYTDAMSTTGTSAGPSSTDLKGAASAIVPSVFALGLVALAHAAFAL
ncbi:hypothetical protein H072_11155 [Dactylellina haptotyla CBS 200.50]|uniref:Uncharacterized protein n=1 Tax=Dactylellina haptotyla (strain CBS 200.50) TaxID=1284197 RepID=S8A2R9_DACHA|nr:hypothetical protein H072_11155 [Dactylellina haptotyla CBS 200.50]